jgi:2-polyprenyl-3-methyl-5-hydroxy-6-metoxy-1,4-benzoquinol methylase
MVVERSARTCLLCGAAFEGRTFLCRECSDRYRGSEVPFEVRQRFYQELDYAYPERSNTYDVYNRPEALLAAIARLPRDVAILEVGAGGGFLLRDLVELGFSDLTGTDITETAVQQLNFRVPEAAVVMADAAALPFKPATFHTVVSSDVIEHLPDVERHLSEVARVLRPGGLYFIKTPNRVAANAYYRLRGLHDSYFWHPSMFTAHELRAALARHGLEMRSLHPPHLTSAQLVKLPGPPVLRPLAARLPLLFIPSFLWPHLEVVAKWTR